MTNQWAVVAAIAGWSVLMYLVGYIMAKHYWHERGFLDGQEATDRYLRDRQRVQANAVPRLGRVDRE